MNDERKTILYCLFLLSFISSVGFQAIQGLPETNEPISLRERQHQ
jgi:hypothetical protein